jgi:hypothetical protein
MVEKTYLTYNKDFHEKMRDIAGLDPRTRGRNPWFTESLRDIFILGMCYAVKKGLAPKEIEERKKDLQESIRINQVIHEDQKFLFRVVAVYLTKDYRTLANDQDVYDLAEKFANAGLEELLNTCYGKWENPSFDLAKMALGENIDQ